MRKAQLIHKTTQLLLKLAIGVSQTSDIEDVVKGTGLFPVKPNSTDYDSSHPLHAQISAILDKYEYPTTEKVQVNCSVNESKKVTFLIETTLDKSSSDSPEQEKLNKDISNKVRFDMLKLLNSLIPKNNPSLQKVSPPGGEVVFNLFTV